MHLASHALVTRIVTYVGPFGSPLESPPWHVFFSSRDRDHMAGCRSLLPHHTALAWRICKAQDHLLLSNVRQSNPHCRHGLTSAVKSVSHRRCTPCNYGVVACIACVAARDALLILIASVDGLASCMSRQSKKFLNVDLGAVWLSCRFS